VRSAAGSQDAISLDMNSLKDLETAVQIEVPEAVGMALKAFKAENPVAYNFIVYELCGILKPAFATPGSAEYANWYNGRRYIGIQIDNIVTTPMRGVIAPPLPPARTITEAVRRRRGLAMGRGET
jgi:hypothetical protein